VKNLIVDDFRQFTFTDPATKRTLKYNLFIPKGYDRDHHKSYPLVLFMHDASMVNVATEGPLVQGLGAVCWASPEDQARHEAFVLAPEYGAVVIDDDYEPSTLFDATANLVESVTQQYSIDSNRRYTTGQSMGAMMSLGLNIRYPDLFAAAFIVAGQWPEAQAVPLAKKNLWILVSADDTKACPGEQAITRGHPGTGHEGQHRAVGRAVHRRRVSGGRPRHEGPADPGELRRVQDRHDRTVRLDHQRAHGYLADRVLDPRHPGLDHAAVAVGGRARVRVTSAGLRR